MDSTMGARNSTASSFALTAVSGTGDVATVVACAPVEAKRPEVALMEPAFTFTFAYAFARVCAFECMFAIVFVSRGSWM